MASTEPSNTDKRQSISLDAELSARVEKHVLRLTKQAPPGSAAITTSHAIRNLIIRGLTEVERERAR